MSQLADATGDQDLRRQSCEKHAKAVEIKPQDPATWDNWASSLLKLYAAAPSHALLEEAREKCSRAEGIQPGAGAFNLACVESRAGNLDECMAWLTKAIEHRAELAEKAQTDPDLAAARGDDRFWAIVGRPRPPQDAANGE